MNGLRMYQHGTTVEACGGRCVFYSRREDGPFYRWSYDDRLGGWLVGRVLKPGLSPKMLVPVIWKNVPSELKRSIAGHYQD